MTEEIDRLKNELDSSETVPPAPIPIDFFSNVTNKSTKLVNNDNPDLFLKGQNRRFEYTLKDQVWVSEIIVKTNGYSKYKDLEFFWKGVSSPEEQRKSSRIEEGSFFVQIDDFISFFAIRPPKQSWNDPAIESVVVWGLSTGEFRRSCAAIGNLQNYREQILNKCQQQIQLAKNAEQERADATGEKRALEQEIETLVAEKEEARQESENARNELETATLQVTEKKSEASDAQNRLTNIEDSIDRKQEESKQLNTELSKLSTELKSLQDDIDIFPSELREFAKEGGRNISYYSILSLIPMGLLLFYTTVLFQGASDLTTIYKSQTELNMWTTFMTRLPFVFISIFIIHACYAISRVFIREVIRINQQRLNLSKISIVAKDIADTSLRGLDLDLEDGEIYELRNKLKMDLIKEHLKDYIDDTYEYNLEVGLWDKVKAWWVSKNSQNPTRNTDG